MTIQNIIDAISEALFQEFGSNHEIYSEKVEQGLKEGCFLVRCLNPTMNRHLGRCYKRTNQFAVQYIPESSEANEECILILERMFNCLESITVLDKPLHGADLHGELSDDVLTFTVNYDCFVLKEEAEIDMTTLSVDTEVKG